MGWIRQDKNSGESAGVFAALDFRFIGDDGAIVPVVPGYRFLWRGREGPANHRGLYV